MNTVVSFRNHKMSKRRKGKASDPRRISDPAESARRGVPPEDWGVNEGALKLAANADIELRETARDESGNVVGRQFEGRRRERYDIFALMHHRPNGTLTAPAFLAVRRLQKDLAILHRSQGASDEIRASGAGQTGALATVTGGFSLARVMAGDRVDEVLSGMAAALAYRLSKKDAEGNVIEPPRFDPAKPKPTYARMIRDLCEFGFGPGLDVVRAHEEAKRVDGKAQAPVARRREPTPNWQAIVTKHTGEKRHLAKYDHVRTAANDLAESYRRIDNEPKERVA